MFNNPARPDTVSRPSYGVGIFAALADPNVFVQVCVELGVVTWPGETDLAPDAMHTEIKKNGIWRLK